MKFSTAVYSSKQRLSQVAYFLKDHIGNATCLCVALFALSLGSCSLAVAQQALATQPNVVLIMADNLGYSDVGSYGATDVQTPNIDSLAREGVRLTDFYSNGPTCSPTRAALISGRYQQRYGLDVKSGLALAIWAGWVSGAGQVTFEVPRDRRTRKNCLGKPRQRDRQAPERLNSHRRLAEILERFNGPELGDH